MDSCKLPYEIVLIMTPARYWDRMWDRERGKDFDFGSVARNSCNALASAMVSAMATALPSPAFSSLFRFLFSSGECPGEYRNGCILPGEGSMEPCLSGSGYRSVYL